MLWEVKEKLSEETKKIIRRTIKQLKISNLLSQEIKLIDIPNEKTVSINANDFSNGIYIYQITTTNNGTSYGNFIVRR